MDIVPINWRNKEQVIALAKGMSVRYGFTVVFNGIFYHICPTAKIETWQGKKVVYQNFGPVKWGTYTPGAMPGELEPIGAPPLNPILQ